MAGAMPGPTPPVPYRSWVAGDVGLGAPVVEHRASLAVAGDVRLDNARSLMAELGLAGHPLPSDAQVLMAAYQRWGDGVAERLEGDFAFALWDGRRRRLLCARDALGVKALYYHLGPGLFAVASDVSALLARPLFPRRLNATAISQYLLASFDDTEATGYRDVLRLPPARALAVDAQRARSWSYWSPSQVDELVLHDDADYEEAFRHALSQSVTSRLGAGTVGVSLSGGLDSSSIACILTGADRTAMTAYTAVFDADPTSDERHWASTVVRRCGAQWRQCDPSSTSPLADWAGASWTGAAPACNPQISVCRVTLGAAADDGVAVLLHGFGGDSVVSHGVAYLAELVGAGHVMRAAAEADALRRRHGRSRRSVARLAVAPFIPDSMLRAWNMARRHPSSPGPALLRPEMARQLPAGDHPRARTARADHVGDVNAGIVASALEASYRVDALAGVERRYPFLERRLVELCVSLPGDQKLRSGWTRSIMRRAMVGLLPEEVLQRPGKADLSPAFSRAMATERAALRELVADPGALGDWIEPGVLGALWYRCQAGGDERAWFSLWRAAVASRWLRHHGFEERPPDGTLPAGPRPQ